MKKVLILNGVNLGKLGTREVDIYGHQTFENYYQTLTLMFPQLDLDYFQSNQVDCLVEKILDSDIYDGIIINPGAFTHTSIVLADAIKSTSTPVVEVHISNLFGREQFRKNSMIASSCVGSISGFGLKSYELALYFFL
ncbi:MAG TPA: type II 3-dehydroquinate dehydratase [Bacteroidales bacterium]|nr:type II 3-dehydroquinate dehydratase [Bacteroidales bacterium]